MSDFASYSVESPQDTKLNKEAAIKPVPKSLKIVFFIKKPPNIVNIQRAFSNYKPML